MANTQGAVVFHGTDVKRQLADNPEFPCDGRSTWIALRDTLVGRWTQQLSWPSTRRPLLSAVGSPPFSDTAFPGLCFYGVCVSPFYLKALLTHGFHCFLTCDKWLFWICHVLASAANAEFLSVSHLNVCLLQIGSGCLVLFIATCPALVKILVLSVWTHQI